MKILCTLTSLCLSFAVLPSIAAETIIIVKSDQSPRISTPVSVLIRSPSRPSAGRSITLVDDSGTALPAQLTKPGLLHGKARGDLRELHFISPAIAAGRRKTYRLVFHDTPVAKENSFHWSDTPDEHRDLAFGDRPVLRYMYEAIDESSPESRERTYKVYHHLYSPDGSRLVTKGPGGKYTHHRGLFYGFNRISYGDKKADTWHCRGDAHLSHEAFLSDEAGPVLGRHRVKIDWHGPGKEVFASEQREMTVFHLPGGQLVQFVSRLQSKVPMLHLDGDPQHAGFQFRADNEVSSKTNKQTYYLRPDGKGDFGATRNWPNDKFQINLPWNVMSFVLGDQRYSAIYLDHPSNPKEARYSERDYGRFGSYFQYDLAQGEQLVLQYRLWLQDGELTPQIAWVMSQGFTRPLEIENK